MTWRRAGLAPTALGDEVIQEVVHRHAAGKLPRRGVTLVLEHLLHVAGEAPADPRARVEGAVRALEGLGIRVEEIRLPRIHHAGPATFAIITAESMAYHEPYLKTRASEYGADVRARLLTGEFVLATQYLKGQRARQVIRAEVDEALRNVDALLFPTTPIPAPRTDEGKRRWMASARMCGPG